MASVILVAAVAGLASASPLASRQWPAGEYPPVSQSQGFTLVANVTDPSKNIFNPPINNWYLGGVHVGAGTNAAVLGLGSGPVFFVNGTGRDVSAAATSIALPPIPVTGQSTPIPQGLQFDDSSSAGAADLAYVGLSDGPGTVGTGIGVGLRDPYAEVFTPYGGGTFVVCNVTNPAYGNPQYPVRFAKYHEDGDKGGVDVPADCVAINLLAQCAELPQLGGADELGIIVEGVKCYENVSSIDWSKY